VVDARGDTHPVGEVADGRGERVARPRHEPDGLDLGSRHGGTPVRQQLDDGGVELLVAQAAGHEQEGVELPVRQARAQAVALLEEPLPGHRHEPAGRRDDAPPRGERRPDVGVGEAGVLHEQGDLPVGGAQPLEQRGRVVARAHDADVVVAVVATELVVEVGGVLVARQDDHRVVHGASVGSRALGVVPATGYGDDRCDCGHAPDQDVCATTADHRSRTAPPPWRPHAGRERNSA
jgi:hypothetical protein